MNRSFLPSVRQCACSPSHPPAAVKRSFHPAPVPSLQKYQPPRQGRRLSATGEQMVITTVAFGDSVVACKVRGRRVGRQGGRLVGHGAALLLMVRIALIAGRE